MIAGILLCALAFVFSSMAANYADDEEIRHTKWHAVFMMFAVICLLTSLSIFWILVYRFFFRS